MQENKKGIVMGVLIFTVIVLLSLVIYAFVLKPAVTGYVINKQVEAQNFVINNILFQLHQNGYVKINVGNSSLILVPYKSSQQQIVGNKSSQQQTIGGNKTTVGKKA